MNFDYGYMNNTKKNDMKLFCLLPYAIGEDIYEKICYVCEKMNEMKQNMIVMTEKKVEEEDDNNRI